MNSSKFVGEIINKYIKDEELKELLITHSRLVAEKALRVAEEADLNDKIDRQFVFDSAMLHDIGIVKCDAPGIHCHGKLPYLAHGLEGGKILRKEGLEEKYSRVCERHTGAGLTKKDVVDGRLPLPIADYLSETLEEKLICYADKFYSKSGDPAKEKSFEKVADSIKRHGEGPFGRFMQLHNMFVPKSSGAKPTI